MHPKSQISSGYSAYKASAPGAQHLRLMSSTNLHRPCSLRVRSAQAIQSIRPQRSEPIISILRAQLLNSNHIAQELLNSDIQLRLCSQETNSVHVEHRENVYVETKVVKKKRTFIKEKATYVLGPMPNKK